MLTAGQREGTVVRVVQLGGILADNNSISDIVFIECFLGAEPRAQHCISTNAFNSYPPVRQVPASSPLVRWKQEAREGGAPGCSC